MQSKAFLSASHAQMAKFRFPTVLLYHTTLSGKNQLYFAIFLANLEELSVLIKTFCMSPPFFEHFSTIFPRRTKKPNIFLVKFTTFFEIQPVSFGCFWRIPLNFCPVFPCSSSLISRSGSRTKLPRSIVFLLCTFLNF